MFEVREVAAEPGSGVVYQPVSLTLQPEQISTIFGASGVGKSQFLRALADLTPHQGEVWLDQRRQSSFKPADWRRSVGYVPAEPAWWADTTAAHFASPPPDDWLAALSLSPALLDAPVERLSTGERQRLALLRTLTLYPRILLLDEPTANLDAQNADAVRRLILHYLSTHQAAALWVTHDAQERHALGGDSIELLPEEGV